MKMVLRGKLALNYKEKKDLKSVTKIPPQETKGMKVI